MSRFSPQERARIAQYEAILLALRARPSLRYHRIADALGCRRARVQKIASNNGFTDLGRV